MGVNLELGARFRKVQNGIGTIAFEANNTKSLTIPKGLLNKSLVLRLTGTLTIGTAAAVGVQEEAPLTLIKKIELVADGNKTFATADAQMLFRLAHTLHEKQAELTAPGATVGAHAFAATIVLDQQALHFISPPDSYFDTRLWERTEVRVQWGAATDLVDPAPTTVLTLSNVQVDVIAEQTAEGVEQILFDKVLTVDQKNVDATSALFKMEIPRTGLLAGILLRSTRDAGAGLGRARVDNIINKVNLRSENTVRHIDNADWDTLQRQWVQEFGIDGGTATGLPIPGYCYIDLTEDALISSAINTFALNSFDLLLDVTRTSGTEEITALYHFFQPRQAVA